MKNKVKTFLIFDLGSNSFKVSLYQNFEFKNEIKHLKTNRYFVELAKKDSDIFTPQQIRNIKKTISTMYKDFSKEIKNGVVLAFATSIFRDKKNTNDLFILIKRQFDLEIELISEELEAKLAAEANKTLIEQNDNILIVDIGGGSVQLSWWYNSNLQISKSLKIGIWSLTKKYIQKSDLHEFEFLLSILIKEIKKLKINQQKLNIYFISGIYRICTDYFSKKNNEKINSLSLKYLNENWKHVITSDDNEILKIIDPNSAHVLKVGMTIIYSLLLFLNAENSFYSDNSVRLGYLIYKLGEI